jgi:hypothetical protein
MHQALHQIPAVIRSLHWDLAVICFDSQNTLFPGPLSPVCSYFPDARDFIEEYTIPAAMATFRRAKTGTLPDSPLASSAQAEYNTESAL